MKKLVKEINEGIHEGLEILPSVDSLEADYGNIFSGDPNYFFSQKKKRKKR